MLEPFAILSYLMAKPFGDPGATPPMHLTLAHVRPHASLPKRYTCRSRHPMPPELRWSNIPDGTQSLVVIMADLDAPRPQSYHWAIYNLPDTVTRYTGNTKAQWARNSWGNPSYQAPCALQRKHHYRVELYALNVMLPEENRLSALELRKALQPYLLATTYRDVTVTP